MNHKLDFVFHKSIQNIFNHFSHLLGIRIAFFSPDGTQLKIGMNIGNCDYCRLIRAKLDYEVKCLNLDKIKLHDAKKSKSLVSYTCHGGLLESIKPIYINDKLIGYLMIGQFRNVKAMPAIILSNWEKKYKSNKLSTAFGQLPYFSADKLVDIFSLFSILVNYIEQQHLIRIQGDNILQNILFYIHDHPEKNISLKQAADIAGRSPSHVSHLFKKIYKKTFKQMQLEIKLEKADEYFKRDTSISIKEVAYNLGYSNPLYFSRIFKNYHGISPNKYKKKIN